MSPCLYKVFSFNVFKIEMHCLLHCLLSWLFPKLYHAAIIVSELWSVMSWCGCVCCHWNIFTLVFSYSYQSMLCWVSAVGYILRSPPAEHISFVCVLVCRSLSMPCSEPFPPSSMCCWYVSYFGSSSASWESTYLRGSTTIVLTKPPVSLSFHQRLKMRQSVRPMTRARLAGRMSKSTLTMLLRDTSHCCKW